MKLRKKFENSPKRLSGKLTKIEKQKRGSKYNIYLDEAFAFSVWEDTLVKLKVSTGDLLTEKDTKAILRFDMTADARNSALRLIGVRPRSVAELRFRLEMRYEPETVSKTIKKLIDIGLLSDEEFVRFWLSNSQSRLRSKRQIIYELRQKRVDEELIDSMVNAIDSQSEKDKAVRLVAKYHKSHPKLVGYELKQKITAFLARKGYGWDDIRAVIESEL